jgi:hypothetical protein
MTFAEEIGAYRFRLLGPRFRPTRDGRYVLPRPDGSPATVLESPQLVLETNNVDLGAVEAELKAPLRELGATRKTATLACAAMVNAAVRHMPEGLAFVGTGVSNDLMFLAGMLHNDQKACVGIDDFGDAGSSREPFRARFDARRSARHSFFEADWRVYFGAGDVPPIGVFLHDADRSYEGQLEGLCAAEPFFAHECLVIVADTNRDPPRRAVLDFARDSRRPWRVVLEERTAGEHPTLWNGLMVLQGGSRGPASPVELATETRLVDPVEVSPRDPHQHPPRVSVLHYRNPWVGVQDYPNLEVIGLNRGKSVKEAFESSTGRYVVVLDPDVELTADALSQAVREAEGGPPLIRRPAPGRAAGRAESSGDGLEAGSAVRRVWRSVSRGAPRRNGPSERWHRPLAQAEYFPSWAGTFDDEHQPQTVTVARALSVTRDNLVALDLDPQLGDMDREIAVRFAQGLRLEGSAARCSRVPDGVVAGRVGAVLTPDGGWLIESVGAVGRAWPELAIDEHGRTQLTEPVRQSDERIATVACELRREWWTENYGHWTFDVLTRVAMLLRAEAPDDVKLLIPEPVLPFQRETLVGLGIAEDRIVPWDGTPTQFRAVYVPTARPAPPFVLPAGVELLRELGASARKASPGRRLFVSRRQLDRTTRISNESELLEAAASLGFVEVTPETLPYREQVRLFSDAEVIAGPHGSGLANAIYMARGTGLCELAPARLHAEKVPNFWNLAACGGQRYGLCIGSGRRVDPKRFKRVLRQVIRSARREPPGTEPAREREAQNA